MSETLEVIDGTAVLLCSTEGDAVRGERDASDLIGNAFHLDAAWVALPVERLADDFFELRTRVAGDITQKFVNYRIGLAVIGDITERTAASASLRDFVREANQGRHLWFLPDLDALRTRLTTKAGGHTAST
ncbi:MAG TPA: DUF4180 domain-containing protein [Yinghuangia sp.]|uniref:DUF4180 domain-containing protein n=1 Tax=Yinghuangia sp. YIM S10712 TaxID=3436930 RepID=UPI002CCFDB5D|nr:DUF4180 domain-containing protein [Yinghuangia sp.]